MAPEKKLLQIIELVKMLPRTNCGECGLKTCMAFATHVLREGKDPSDCPYWQPEDLAYVKQRLVEQGEDTAYPDHLFSARDFVRQKIADYDLAGLAGTLGVEVVSGLESPTLKISLLGRDYLVNREEITVATPETAEQDLWEHVLLYNYVAEAGSSPLTGNWLPMENLPGSLAKRKAFAAGCEEKLAAHFNGRGAALTRALQKLKADFSELPGNAEVAAILYPLPKVPFQLLFWDGDPEDGFPPQVKVLFDETVLDYLDIESLVFLGEKTAARLIEIDR